MDSAKKISKKIGKAIYDYKMIENNDRILLALSGGKDSMTLLYDLIKRQKSFPIKYEILAAHITTDISKSNEERIIKKLNELNVDYIVKHISLKERLKPGKQLGCYWCSNQRRIELLRIAEEKKCNKIALGHHMDDIIETFLINIFFKAEIATMLPVMKYIKFNHTIIRPLCYVKEIDIIDFSKQMGFFGLTCNCGYDTKSKRLVIKQIVKELAEKHKGIRENIFNSMKNINTEYMP